MKYIAPSLNTVHFTIEKGFAASDLDEEDFEITTTIDDIWGIPEKGEKILVLHEGFQIMEIGRISGLKTWSFQYLKCCVTDKRIILIPQDKTPNRRTVEVLGRLSGSFVGKHIFIKEFYDKVLHGPVSLLREDISQIDIGTDEYPSPKLLSIFIKEQRIILGNTNVSYNTDIQAAFTYPHWEWGNSAPRLN